MDPISLAISAVGLGMQIFGGSKQADNAKEFARQSAAISKDEASQEEGINAQKQQAMELDAKRRSVEQMRQTQQAQALATSRATSQGAQFGSGLQGGLAEVQDQGNFNLQGINQSLQIGRNIAGYNQNITQDKYKMADAQATYGVNSATNQGLTSLGGALMSAGPTIGKLGSGLNFNGGNGGFGLGSIFMGGNTPSGL